MSLQDYRHIQVRFKPLLACNLEVTEPTTNHLVQKTTYPPRQPGGGMRFQEHQTSIPSPSTFSKPPQQFGNDVYQQQQNGPAAVLANALNQVCYACRFAYIPSPSIETTSIQLETDHTRMIEFQHRDRRQNPNQQ